MGLSSPCVRVCKLDQHNICLGCKRTLEEIARWQQYTEQEKQEVLQQLKGR
jgi:predicted Fe-S protein YdhL (DUF1289 family)